MNKKIVIILILFFGLTGLAFVFEDENQDGQDLNQDIQDVKDDSGTEAEGGGDLKLESEGEKKEEVHPMAIERLRALEYPGDDFVIEETLANGSNYKQYVASYQSEGLKINGLLTVPLAERPEGGFPAVIFIHGYIPPKQYSTTESYPTYQATLAKAGFVTFKPDLRGHDNSEGEPVNAHFSEKYVIDTLNAIAYLKNYEEINPERIGYWGHSNGGENGLRIAVISDEINAAVLWAGVVGSFEDMLETYNQKIGFLDLTKEDNEDAKAIVDKYGLPSENREFWNKIDPHTYLGDISIPIQLHHGTNDESVPIELSLSLKEELEKAGKEVEYFEYPGDDHNIGANSAQAWQRSIEFFKENL
jgi:dipeptidyl aminopeptidase/acylaminoacyl peptidase